MQRREAKSLGYRLMAAGLAALALSACSAGNLGGASAFGSAQAEPTYVSNLGSYTADTALVEARNHFRNNDFGYSATLYKRLVELRPSDPEGYVGLAASYDRLHRFDLADRAYAALFKLTGGTTQYYNNVGYSNLLRGNLKTALANFRSASRLDPDNAVIANNLRLLSNATTSA